MSLIRVRRDRKKNWIDQKKHFNPKSLMMALVVLVVVIWYLGVRF